MMCEQIWLPTSTETTLYSVGKIDAESKTRLSVGLLQSSTKLLLLIVHVNSASCVNRTLRSSTVVPAMLVTSNFICGTRLSSGSSRQVVGAFTALTLVGSLVLVAIYRTIPVESSGWSFATPAQAFTQNARSQ